MPARRAQPRLSLRRLVAATTLCASLLLPGCIESSKSPRDSASGKSSAQADDLSASERGVANGLELVWWVVDDQDGVLGRALASASLNVPDADPGSADRWRAAGLRLVTVPLRDMPSITSNLPVIGRVQREWMGQLPRWTVAVRGSMSEAMTISTAQAAGIPDEPLTLGAGRLRMLVRCWLNPATTDAGFAASLRVELVPQHEEKPDEARALQSALGLARKPGIEGEGIVFTSLLMGLQAREGTAYLIVPESPEVVWKAERPEALDRDELPIADPNAPVADRPAGKLDAAVAGPGPSGDLGSADLPIPYEEAPRVDAPPAPDDGRGKAELPVKPRLLEPVSRRSVPFKLRTLGEAMLTDAPAGGQARAKVVLVLIPRVPEKYRLLTEAPR